VKYLFCLLLVGCASSAPDPTALTKTGGQLTYCDGVAFATKADAGGAAGWAAYDTCMYEGGLR